MGGTADEIGTTRGGQIVVHSGKGLRLRAAAFVAALYLSVVGSQAFAGGGVCGSQADCGAVVSDGILDGCCVAHTPQMWFRADYLLWQINGSDIPALVTSSPAGTPLAQAGVLGDPSTTILSGSDEINDGWRSGFALSGGYLFDPCRGLSVVGDYFNAGRDSYGYVTGPNTGDVISRPFYNSETGMNDNELVDVPNELAGRVRVASYEDFQGAGLGLQKCLWNCCDPCSGRETSLALVGGYRYYQHDSMLGVQEDLLVLPGTTSPLVPGTTIDVRDRFTAENQFNGGELGLQGRIQRREWWIDGMALLAVGGNRRTVNVDGTTTNVVPNVGTSSNAGGLLTSSATNIGHYSDTEAAVIPRFRLGAGCQLTEFLAVRCGYNVIIWGDVAQAAEHLPPGLAVDPRNLPPIQAGGSGDPAFPGVQGSTIVAHGFDLGLELAY